MKDLLCGLEREARLHQWTITFLQSLGYHHVQDILIRRAHHLPIRKAPRHLRLLLSLTVKHRDACLLVLLPLLVL